MASLDELMKRNAMASSFPNAQMSPIPTTEEERQRILLQNRLQDASALNAQSIKARQRATTLPAPEMIQPQQDFLTPSGKGGVMDFVKGILSQRLQSKGLRRDPLDIARQNAVNLQGFDERVSTLGRQAQEAQALSQQMRERAILQARQAGIPVDPTLGLSSSAQVENLVRTTGGDMTPPEQLALSQTGGMMEGADRTRASVQMLRDMNIITPQAADTVLNASDAKVSEEFGKLRIPVSGADYLPGDTQSPTGEIFFNPQYSAEDRFENREFGKILTAGQRIENKEYAKTHQKYVDVGAQTDAKNLNDLNTALGYLINADDSGSYTFTGPVAGLIPDALRAFYDEGQKSLDARAAIRNVVQKTFREILGGQFAFLEGERLIQTAYDENLPPEYNIRRIRNLYAQALRIADRKRLRAEHWRDNGTLYGDEARTLDFNLDAEVENMAKFYENYDTAFDLYSVKEINGDPEIPGDLGLYQILEADAAAGNKDSQKEFKKLQEYVAQNRNRFKEIL